MARTTHNGTPGMVAEFFRRRDEVTGRDDRRPTADEIRAMVAEQVRAELEIVLAALDAERKAGS
jgi:hypothetical protein